MKVIVIGAGVTGPLVAMLLKYKGFDPVIYERHASPPSGGLSLLLSGQVFKVLNIIGLAEEAIAISQPMDRVLQTSEVTGRVLIDAPIYANIRETTGWPICAVVRTTLSNFLLESAQRRGIPVYLGKKLVDVKQDDEKVTASFEDGSSDEGELLLGCDGLHSKVRDGLFGATPVEYTGLTAIGGFTPYTDTVRATAPYTALQVTGDGCHFVCLPTSENMYMWVVNLPGEPETKEDWRTAEGQKVANMLDSLPPVNWGGDAGQIILNSAEVVRFGLYLRPISPVWHKGRTVLLGDAAHPTTPFLGQGANQSSEDVYHLVCMLVKHAPLTTEDIDKAFAEYTAIRLPRVVKTIEQTKREGEARMARSREALLAREAQQAKGLESDMWKVILEMLYVDTKVLMSPVTGHFSRSKFDRVTDISSVEVEYRFLMDEGALKEKGAMREKGLDSETWKVMMEMMMGPFPTGGSEI
ncbi:FAD/NAD(P)-binding domain-containing protein [Calocera cornea HHB12733]|uniref:FAD/NAD(P)-binding domain-containing protein n=1 Tax=Calocera cornea HHB12733 TaxID=1353952 RepID=A0A165D4S7_9BASI|nr:FAD/NAD(P)-binding domain-containing protein [Calocera cornea HHB12733]